MLSFRAVEIILFLIILEVVTSSINQITEHDSVNKTKKHDARRTKKKSRSTSSSSADRGDSSGDSAESLGLSVSKTSTSSSENTKRQKPKDSLERKGWRKWHRKCTPCPDVMWKKWKDPSINWICGAYQRARRSFKSACMMHYRNCQDGTMFVKVHDHRCENDTTPTKRYGKHFFYEYKAVLSDDSTDTRESTSEEHGPNGDWS